MRPLGHDLVAVDDPFVLSDVVLDRLYQRAGLIACQLGCCLVGYNRGAEKSVQEFDKEEVTRGGVWIGVLVRAPIEVLGPRGDAVSVDANFVDVAAEVYLHVRLVLDGSLPRHTQCEMVTDHPHDRSPKGFTHLCILKVIRF